MLAEARREQAKLGIFPTAAPKASSKGWQAMPGAPALVRYLEVFFFFQNYLPSSLFPLSLLARVNAWIMKILADSFLALSQKIMCFLTLFAPCSVGVNGYYIVGFKLSFFGILVLVIVPVGWCFSSYPLSSQLIALS